jgi:Domain of unknown function (DUF4160)
MPTLLKQNGFDIRMYFDEHAPSHVHVFKAGGQAKIELGNGQQPPSLIMVQGMSTKDAKRAVEIVTKYQDKLLETWEEFHG